MKRSFGDRLDLWFDQLRPLPAATMVMLAGTLFFFALALGLKDRPVEPPVQVVVTQVAGGR